MKVRKQKGDEIMWIRKVGDHYTAYIGTLKMKYPIYQASRDTKERAINAALNGTGYDINYLTIKDLT